MSEETQVFRHVQSSIHGFVGKCREIFVPCVGIFDTRGGYDGTVRLVRGDEAGSSRNRSRLRLFDSVLTALYNAPHYE